MIGLTQKKFQQIIFSKLKIPIVLYYSNTCTYSDIDEHDVTSLIIRKLTFKAQFLPQKAFVWGKKGMAMAIIG